MSIESKKIISSADIFLRDQEVVLYSLKNSFGFEVFRYFFLTNQRFIITFRNFPKAYLQVSVPIVEVKSIVTTNRNALLINHFLWLQTDGEFLTLRAEKKKIFEIGGKIGEVCQSLGRDIEFKELEVLKGSKSLGILLFLYGLVALVVVLKLIFIGAFTRMDQLISTGSLIVIFVGSVIWGRIRGR